MGFVNSRNMHTLHRGKIILTVCILLMPLFGMAQYNAYQFDYKYESRFAHFGILMGFNKTDYRVKQSEKFLYNDTLRSVQSVKGPGFDLGIVSNVHLGKNFDLRFLPSMSFTEKNLEYQTFIDTVFNQKIESILLNFPLLLKFKSNPYKDMRFYVLGGIRYSYDLASNALSRNAESVVKVNRHDFALVYGMGFEIYFPYFIFAPEIRISQGIMNVHSLDKNLSFSNILDKLFTRGFSIVINFEG
jgi:Outer membrane protein beta-barrel domain